ncbi:Uncharacterised protein [Mycobacteroides abscessus subsp. abscessus]|nr:Uncharacterised protein [Mycobacteroides abscessus subsp. abscessus]
MTSVSIAPGRRPLWLVTARRTLTRARKSRRRFRRHVLATAAPPRNVRDRRRMAPAWPPSSQTLSAAKTRRRLGPRERRKG